MSTDINSTTFLVKGTLIALLTFFGTLFVGNDAMAFGCDEACEEALGEGGSLRAAADAACLHPQTQQQDNLYHCVLWGW